MPKWSWVLPVFAAFVTLIAVADPAAHLVVERAWSRATPPSAKNGAGYLTIINRGKAVERLLRAESPVAEHTELHLMAMKDGVMSMRELTEGVEIPAQASLVLAPKGTHLMFIGLHHPLAEGDQVPVTLHFEKGGAQKTSLVVLSVGAAGPKP